ncbi:MAG: PDZ domain-containing protein [Bacteroidota bacterium]
MKAKFYKYALWIFLTWIVQSCSLYNAIIHFNKQEIAFDKQKHKFEFLNNQVMIKTGFPDNKFYNFILDLGAMRSVIFLDSNFTNLIQTKKPVYSHSKNLSADGYKSRAAFYEFGDLSTDWFTIKNSFISTSIHPYKNYCNRLCGIWGSDIFASTINGKGNFILKIGMEDSTLAIIDSLPPITDWIRVGKTQNKIHPMFIIKMNIGSETFEFIFDTGFTGSILLSPNEYKRLRKSSNYSSKEEVIYGFITNTLSGIKPDTARRIKSNIFIRDGISADSILIYSLNSTIFNLIGMDFIKRFNVMVDYQNYQLYFQPNPNYRNNEENFFLKKGMRPNNSITDGFRIMNIYVNSIAEKAGLKIGDEIISINNIRIDEGDPCEIERIYNDLDGNIVDNEIIVKRGEEILKFIL